MSGATRFILGGIVGALGLLGVLGAANAELGSSLYYAGLLAFVAAVAYDFYLIKQACDEYERHVRGEGP
jgi:hypothetical protein